MNYLIKILILKIFLKPFTTSTQNKNSDIRVSLIKFSMKKKWKITKRKRKLNDFKCLSEGCLKANCPLTRVAQREFMTNRSLRERFGIDPKNSAIASRLIKEALELGIVRLHDPDAPPSSAVTSLSGHDLFDGYLIATQIKSAQKQKNY